jgi:hypothetical protein
MKLAPKHQKHGFPRDIWWVGAKSITFSVYNYVMNSLLNTFNMPCNILTFCQNEKNGLGANAWCKFYEVTL